MNKEKIYVSSTVRKGCRDIWNAFMVKGATFNEHDIPYCPTTAKSIPEMIITYDEARRIYKKEIEHKNVSLYGIVVPDEKGFVSSFQEKPSIETAKSNLANTGIYIFSYEIFNFIPENTFYDFAKNVFPTILSSGLKINTYITDGYWSDIGSVEQYKKSNFDILLNGIKAYNPQVQKIGNALCILGENVVLSQNVQFEDKCIIGNNCKIGKNVKIKNSIIWDYVEIADNAVIENSIILSGEKVNENLKDQIYSEMKIKTAV